MKHKERLAFKRDKIRRLWIYGHHTINEIAEILNKDPEFIHKCGKIAVPTVHYQLKKIKAELEQMIDGDDLEKFTAEFARSVEFQDGEISDCTKLIESPDIKLEDKIRLISLRHKIEIDKMTLLSDRAVPLTVKKWKNDRKELTNRILPKINEPEEPKDFSNQLEFRTVKEDG